MISERLSNVVKAIRLRYAVLFVLLMTALYLTVIYPWMQDWGSTAAEQGMALPGDELLPEGASRNTLAITINAPKEAVWQWLVQIGQDRAGFYTYTWLENIIGADIHNANEIHPEWQKLSAGDTWRLMPSDYLWGAVNDAGSPVLMIEPGKALVLKMWGAHVLIPINAQTTRLLVRGESAPDNLAMKLTVEPIVFTLSRRMLLGLKARAEGLPDAPTVIMVAAHLGWAMTGISIAALFLSDRRRRFWVGLPIAAGLPALLSTGDIQAALAAFIAAGLTVLGFLIYGRSWWGSYLIIGSAVLLVLLLAPEAYTAFGLTFALLLACLGAVIASRPRTADEAARQLAASTR